MIDRLTEALRRLEPQPTAEELADALWLAAWFRACGDSPSEQPIQADRPQLGAHDDGEAPTSDQRPSQRPAPASPGPVVRPTTQAGFYVSREGADDGGLVRSPGVPAIHSALEIARALRPLRVRSESPTERRLDETATSLLAAETGLWTPVLRPSLERWLDLALVVDGSSSADLWRRTVDEFTAVLEQLGAFRDIRVWRLDTDSDRLLVQPGAGGTRGVLRSPSELVDPTHRRVILMLSDCTGAAWQNGLMGALLERWARAGPLAIIQPLPQRLWRRGAVALESVRIGAASRGQSNDRLRVSTREPDGWLPPGVAVPVMELDARWFGRWAGIVGAGAGKECEAIALFTGRPVAEVVPEFGPDGLLPLERVMRFRATSSPAAFELAGYLAAAPLTMPVMRLVQRAMMPNSTPAHLAEVFFGDLLRKAKDQDGGEIEYEFHDGVREILLGSLRRSAAKRVLREVWNIVRDRLDSPFDFPALLSAIPTGASGLPQDQPFAQVAAQVLVRLGGRYAEIAQQLIAAQPDIAPRVEEPGTRRALPGTSGNAATGQSASSPTLARPDSLRGGLPPRNPNFTGRNALLSEIEELLGSSMVTALLPSTPHGMGGEGKSQLAVQYAHLHAQKYNLIWWIPAEDATLARSSLAALARRLSTPPTDDITNLVDNLFEVLKGGTLFRRWLLIYDNAGDPADITALMPTTAEPGTHVLAPSTPYGDILVTSRNRSWESVAATVSVSVFERGESISFLRRRAPGISAEQADRLSEKIGDLPLALEQAAAWHVVTGAGVDDYLGRIDQSLELLASIELPNDFPMQLAATLDVGLRQLRETTVAAGRLLDLWAFFSPEPVNIGLLRAGAKAELPPLLSTVLKEDRSLADAMRQISLLGLARFDPQPGSLQVHRLVRTLLRAQLNLEEQREVRDQVHAILAAATPDEPPSDATTWERRATITAHVLPAELIEGSSKEAKDVVLDQATFLYNTGDLEGSRLVAQRARDHWKELSGPDDVFVLTAGRLVANALRQLGDLAGAAELNRDVLTRMRERLGPDDPSTLFTAMGSGADLRLNGKFVEAYELDEDTWGRSRRLGADRLDTLRAANNMGIDLRLLGRFHEAYAIDSDTLRRLRRSWAKHSNIVLITSHLARDLQGLGEYSAALEVQERALSDLPIQLGPDHTYTLQAQVAYAGILRKAGATESAAVTAEETLRRYIRRFGENHPDTLAATHSLALAQVAVRNAGEARRLAERALTGYEAIMGRDHPFTHVSAATLAICLRALGKHQAALDAAGSAFEKLRANGLGQDHFYAMCCSVGLTNSLVMLNRLDEAYVLSLDQLRDFWRVHGRQHPYSLACAHNHAIICKRLGRESPQLPPGTDPVSDLRKRLGIDHPEVRSAAAGVLLECDAEPIPL